MAASLRLRRSLGASSNARRYFLRKITAVKGSPLSIVASSFVDGNTKSPPAGVSGAAFPHQERPSFAWSKRHLSGTTKAFEYEPVFQYGATPRDDPTEVGLSWIYVDGFSLRSYLPLVCSSHLTFLSIFMRPNEKRSPIHTRAC